MYQQLAEEGPAENASAPASCSSGVVIGRWDAAPDLERFLASFYRYFEVKGYRGVLAVHLSHLVALAFTIGFSFILLFFVNWQALLSCDSEETCRNVLLCYAKPFEQISLWRGVVLLSFGLFSVYWIFNVVAAYQNVRDAAEISSYYKDRLGIVSDEILATMSWSEVVSRLIEQQKASPFCIVQDELTALEIANIIMREDNFMIAFTNHQTFTSRLPWWIPARVVHTRSVLWNLRAAVFNYIFDSRSRIRGDFLDRPSALAQRLRWLGFMNLVLVVPVLIFVTIYFFMRHAEEFRSHRASPFQRQWTDLARWTFREFNELPHQFKARMIKAQHTAEAYVRTTQPRAPVLEALQRCVKYVAGSILAVLLVVALWDETPLLFVKIQDKNLLWYLAFFGFLFAVADSAEDAPPQPGFPATAPSSSRRTGGSAPSTPLNLYCAMMRLVKCIHYLPPTWRPPVPLGAMVGSCGGSVRRAKLSQHFTQVRSDLVNDLFVHRIQVLIEELIGVILTPILLIYYLPEAAADIVEVVNFTRHSSPNLGDWCGFGCLDPSKNGSEFYGGPSLQDGGSRGPVELESGQQQHSVRNPLSSQQQGILISNGGKLEKSVISFILAHRLSYEQRGGDFDDGPFNSQGRSTRGAPSLKPSLGEEIRRSVQRLASESLQFAASSSANGPSASQILQSLSTSASQRIPLLQNTNQNDLSIPLMEFNRTSAGNREVETGEGVAMFEMTQSDDGVSWSGPASAGGATAGGYSPDTFESFSMATPSNSRTLSKATPGNSEAGAFIDACESVDVADLQEEPMERAAGKVWGYPNSALQLMYNLEEFQERELSMSSPHVEMYAVLPEELLRAERATLALDGSPCAASLTTDYDEVEQGSCSSHFFWQEILYDYHSGRHLPSGDGGHARGGDAANFERLDMDSPSLHTRPVHLGCALQ